MNTTRRYRAVVVALDETDTADPDDYREEIDFDATAVDLGKIVASITCLEQGLDLGLFMHAFGSDPLRMRDG